jgi:hypothetical protein
VPEAGACFDQIQAANGAIDVYFLLDRSASMATVDPPNDVANTRYHRAEQSIDLFRIQRAFPYRLGIGFFPISNSGSAASCVVDDYAVPSVPLDGSVGQRDLPDAIAAQTLEGGAPMVQALEGALRYVRSFKPDPSSGVVSRTPASVALISDGAPTGCSGSVAAAAAIARDAYQASPRILTFVVGVGPESAELEPIAQAGGTHRVFRGGPTDLHDAFERITRTHALCEIAVIDRIRAADFHRIRVRTRLRNSDNFEIAARVSNGSSCGAAGGWFSEPEADPTMLLLCPSTCAAVVDAPASQVVVGLDCPMTPSAP